MKNIANTYKLAAMENESKPGFLERFSFISRNVELVAIPIALLAGSGGAAALFGLGAAFDHAAGEHLKAQRLKKAGK